MTVIYNTSIKKNIYKRQRRREEEEEEEDDDDINQV